MSEELAYGLIGGLIVAAITALVLHSQMKPVARKHSAERYVEEGGLQLHRKEDTYLNTTETRRTIQRVDPQAKPGGSPGKARRHGRNPAGRPAGKPGRKPAGRQARGQAHRPWRQPAQINNRSEQIRFCTESLRHKSYAAEIFL